jgi:2'-5' RNA ligase
MFEASGRETGVNSYALISYLPDPVGELLNQLRRALKPDCLAKVHLTILPPRPLRTGPDEAWDALQNQLQDFEPLAIELGDIEMFPETQVIYVSIKSVSLKFGYHDLVAMHDRLNVGPSAFSEPFDYHPHITLAQELDRSAVAAAFELATRRWNEFRGERHMLIDRLTFVQNTLENRWMDLASLDLVSRVAR